MSAELWRPVPEYEGLYEVSSHGRVRSFHRGGRIRKPGRDQTGYPAVVLYKAGVKPWPATIHRLVCRVFNGEPSALHSQVAHLDGDLANCRATNLKWVSNLPTPP